MVITLDGPAGTGKSTICIELAKALNFFQLDTGAMFRAVAYQVLKTNTPQEEQAICQLIPTLHLEIQLQSGENRVFIQGQDVSSEIRTPEIGNLASHLGTLKGVRLLLLDLQRMYGKKYSIVTEGRDTGTVVFPDAEIKFFLEADPKIRALRRMKDYQAKGVNRLFEDVLEEIMNRDKTDREREVAPLKMAEDAILVDTSQMSIQEVKTTLLQIIYKKYPHLAPLE